MSEVITINTETASVLTEEDITILQLFDDKFPLLKEIMPEYTGTLPNSEMTKLIKRMQLTRKTFQGLGLSANQCGIRARVFVIGSLDGQIEFNCINPKVVGVSAEVIKEREGCLSYPALDVMITRPENIDVEFTNEKGELVKTNLSGLTARCFLHELDHLNGKRLEDHVGKTSMIMARQKQQKRMKKIERLYKSGKLQF